MAGNILIVEDSVELGTSLAEIAREAGFRRVDMARDAAEAKDAWRCNPNLYDVVVLDINLDDIGGAVNRDGWDVLRGFRRTRHDFIVLIHTGALTPRDREVLAAVSALPIATYLKGKHDKELTERIIALGRAFASARSPQFTDVETSELSTIACMDAPCLLIGPAGSGKSVKARALALQSHCDDARILSINCAGLSAELAESILFGYTAGAFTGAARDTMGLMMVASGFSGLNDHYQQTRSPKGYLAYRSPKPIWGAVVLDEIGALDYRVQGKLLSVLEGEPIMPLGWSGPGFLPNFRVVAATNEVETLKCRDKFRPDLLFRLTTWVLQCQPASGEPDSKLEELIRRTRIELRTEGIRSDVINPSIQDSAVAWLLQRKGELVGGVRELHSIVQRAWLFARRRGVRTIAVEHMEEAWRFSGEIYSALALEDQDAHAAAMGAGARDLKAIRAEISGIVDTPPDKLTKKVVQKWLQENPQALERRAQLRSVMASNVNDLPKVLGFRSKRPDAWLRQLFSRTRASREGEQ